MNIHFESQIAKELGVPSAIMLENFAYWIKKNKANNKHFYDNEYWTYNTIEAFTEMFEFWSAKQIRTVIEKLRNDDLIKVGNYNKKGYDRTLWYSFTEKGYKLIEKYYFIDLKPSDSDICPKRQMDLPKKANGFDQKGKPIPYTITDTITDNMYIVFDKWNELKIGIVHKDIKPIETEIKKAIKKYKINNILIAIERLDLAVKDKNYFYNQKWSLKNFLKQSNGIENWLDEGQYYNNYLNANPNYQQKNKATTKAATEKINVDDIISKLRSEEI